MKIAVFGSGVVGQTISEKLDGLGHQVSLGTRSVKDSLERSDPDSFGRPPLKEWSLSHPEIKISSYEEAAAFGELLINATNGHGALPALEQAGKTNLAGKVLIDISNPLEFSKGMPPTLFICNTDSLGEKIQRSFPEVKVVKSLNTMTAAVMVNPSLVPGDHNVFVSGNDGDAKSNVKALLITFGWQEKNIIDMGDISTARGTEQLLPIWIRLMGALKTPMFNFNVVVAG